MLAEQTHQPLLAIDNGEMPDPLLQHQGRRVGNRRFRMNAAQRRGHHLGKCWVTRLAQVEADDVTLGNDALGVSVFNHHDATGATAFHGLEGGCQVGIRRQARKHPFHQAVDGIHLTVVIEAEMAAEVGFADDAEHLIGVIGHDQVADAQPGRGAIRLADVGVAAHGTHRRSHEFAHRAMQTVMAMHRMQHVALGEDAGEAIAIENDDRRDFCLDHQPRCVGQRGIWSDAVGVQGHQVGDGCHARILV